MPYDGTWQQVDPPPAYGWPVTRVLIVEDERLLLRTR